MSLLVRLADNMTTVRVVIRINQSAVAGILTTDAVQNRMDNAADTALRMQKSLVPVDTGNLSRHLGIKKTADGLGRLVGAFDVDYAAAVETGHQTKAGTWVPAQPYIRPSIDAVRRSLGNA
jgi:hypothetical protein